MSSQITSPFGWGSTAREVPAGHDRSGQTRIVPAPPTGTNHFGHCLLTAGLAHALELGAKESGQASRLVSLTSIGHRRSGINWDDIHYRTRPYDKWESYGQAKTANSLFAVGFHAHFK